MWLERSTFSLHSDLPDGQAQVSALPVGGRAYFNEFMEYYMSFFTAIAAFKGAFLGALLGNNSPAQRPETTSSHVHKPSHLAYSSPTGYGHSLRERPGQGHPHPYPVCEDPLPHRPLHSLVSLSR